jgi:hypothetical protein
MACGQGRHISAAAAMILPMNNPRPRQPGIIRILFMWLWMFWTREAECGGEQLSSTSLRWA